MDAQLKKDNLPKEGLICWVDCLTFVSLLKLISIHRRQKLKEIHYLEINPAVERFIKFFKQSSIPIIPLEIKNKFFQLYKMLDKMHALPAQSVTNGPHFQSSLNRFLRILDDQYDGQKITFYFYYALAEELRTPLLLIHEMEAFYENKKNFALNNGLLLIRDIYWAKQLKEAYRENFRDLQCYANLKNFFLIWSHTIKIILELLFNRLIILFRKEKKPSALNTRDSRYKVAVLYAHGTDLTKKCDYYWLPHSGINPQDVIVYFKHHGRPPTQEAIRQLAEQNIPWIKLLPWHLNLKPFFPLSFELNIFPIRKFIGDLQKLFHLNMKCLKTCFREKDKGFLWFWSRGLHLLNDLHLFESFFEYHQVKIHYSHYETGRHMFAANMAIDRLQGVDLCHHWSNYDFVDLDIGKPHDIYFIWGAHFQKLFEQKFYPVKYFVLTGYPYDYLFPYYRPPANELRRQLSDRGVTTIISFFDQGLTSYPSRWNRAQEKLYRLLLQEVITNKKIGLLIKPKKATGPNGINNKFPFISSLIEEAKKTGRCLILDGNRFPCEASLASDLAIGVGVSSTPSIEAALAGIKAVTFNANQWVDHPMYAQGRDKIIFNDSEDLMKRVKNFEVNRDQTSFGDYSFVLDDVDPFRDGKARERVGSYVHALMKGFAKGQSKEQVLESACEFYRTRYGSDKVIDHANVEVLN